MSLAEMPAHQTGAERLSDELIENSNKNRKHYGSYCWSVIAINLGSAIAAALAGLIIHAPSSLSRRRSNARLR